MLTNQEVAKSKRRRKKDFEIQTRERASLEIESQAGPHNDEVHANESGEHACLLRRSINI